MADDIPLFPIAEWKIGPVTAYEMVTMQFGFLTGPMQPPSEANQSPYYALTAPQAEELIQQIQRALDLLKTAGPQASLGQKH